MPYTQYNSPFAKVRKTTTGEGRNFRSTEEGVVKMLEEEKHFVQDQQDGKVKEEELLDEDGNVK